MRLIWPFAGGKINLFGLLWLVYFTSNLGRLSYTACMIDIIDKGVLTTASAGLVGTGFFICYGVGQLVSGYIGGHFNPHRLIFIGLSCSALANFAMGFAQTGAFMLVIWCLNGLVQSILWPPLLRIIVENFSEPERSKVCFNISTTAPIAVMLSYLSCAGIITILSWRDVFYFYLVVLFAVSGLWFFAFGKIARNVPHNAKPSEDIGNFRNTKFPDEKKYPKHDFFDGKNATGAAIVLFCLALIIQGALRDGLRAWMPDYISRFFSFPASTAIFYAGIIPPIDICGIYLCRTLFSRIKNEGKTSIYLFSASFIAVLLLRFAGKHNIYITLLAFAVIIACMNGINTMLVTFVPARFALYGLVSFMTGLTNSMVYVGSSISNFGIALIVEKAGWEILLTLLSILAMASILFCVLAPPRWALFVKKSSGER